VSDAVSPASRCRAARGKRARRSAWLSATIVASGLWLLSGCSSKCEEAEDNAYLNVEGFVPLPVSAPASIYIVACRAGLCSEGELNALPSPDSVDGWWTTEGKAVLSGAVSASCATYHRFSRPADQAWIPVWCGLHGTPELEDGILKDGDSELVWVQIHNLATGALLVHFESIVTYEEYEGECSVTTLHAEARW
jgi:hypothetical protein